MANNAIACFDFLAPTSDTIVHGENDEDRLITFLEEHGKKWCMQKIKSSDDEEILFQVRISLKKRKYVESAKRWFTQQGFFDIVPSGTLKGAAFYALGNEERLVKGPWTSKTAPQKPFVPFQNQGELLPWQKTILDSAEERNETGKISTVTDAPFDEVERFLGRLTCLGFPVIQQLMYTSEEDLIHIVCRTLKIQRNRDPKLIVVDARLNVFENGEEMLLIRAIETLLSGHVFYRNGSKVVRWRYHRPQVWVFSGPVQHWTSWKVSNIDGSLEKMAPKKRISFEMVDEMLTGGDHDDRERERDSLLGLFSSLSGPTKQKEEDEADNRKADDDENISLLSKADDGDDEGISLLSTQSAASLSSADELLAPFGLRKSPVAIAENGSAGGYVTLPTNDVDDEKIILHNGLEPWEEFLSD